MLVADYSGYYECRECGAEGDIVRPAKHKAVCSVPEKIARARREDALKEQAARVRAAEIRAHWESMDDELLVRNLHGQRKVVRDYAKILAAVEEDFRAGLDVVRERGLDI